jgi:hypothetical protein
MLAGPPTQAADSTTIHLAEPAGLADAAPLGDMLQDRLGPLGREPRVEEGCPLPLGEADLAGTAPEQAARLVGAIAACHGQISGPPLAMLGALRIQTPEAREVVHGSGSPVRSTRLPDSCVIPMR